jgi:5-carboxymethyl-2-hydroxymuconic-semialdehyde dehydrogenase
VTRPDGLPEQILHFIGGKQVPSVSGATFDNLHPATNRPYCTVAAGSAADVSAAVAAAQSAFADGPWAGLLPRKRAEMLHAIADAI